jgi:lysyl-tRNA synthetase class 1
LPVPSVTVPFRTLSSIADVTAGSADLISRVVEHVGFPHTSVDELEPRLARAMAWTASLPADERTTVRSTPDTERLAALTEEEELWLRIFLDRLPASMDLDEVTSVVYGVPKVARGLGFEDAPTDQVKADQKDFFRLLYNLLVDADRGPRLPTLVLALGPAKVRQLLGA